MDKQVVMLQNCNLSQAFRRIVFLLCESRQEQAFAVFSRALDTGEVTNSLFLVYPFVVHEANHEMETIFEGSCSEKVLQTLFEKVEKRQSLESLKTLVNRGNTSLEKIEQQVAQITFQEALLQSRFDILSLITTHEKDLLLSSQIIFSLLSHKRWSLLHYLSRKYQIFQIKEIRPKLSNTSISQESVKRVDSLASNSLLLLSHPLKRITSQFGFFQFLYEVQQLSSHKLKIIKSFQSPLFFSFLLHCKLNHLQLPEENLIIFFLENRLQNQASFLLKEGFIIKVRYMEIAIQNELDSFTLEFVLLYLKRIIAPIHLIPLVINKLESRAELSQFYLFLLSTLSRLLRYPTKSRLLMLLQSQLQLASDIRHSLFFQVRNPLKICILWIEFLQTNYCSYLGPLQFKAKNLIQSLTQLSVSLIEKSQRSYTLQQLFMDRDMRGRSVLSLISLTNTLNLLNNPYVAQRIQEMWSGSDTSILGNLNLVSFTLSKSKRFNFSYTEWQRGLKLPFTSSLLLLFCLTFLILLSLFIFIYKYQTIFNLYESILTTGTSFQTPSALQFHCHQAQSFTIISNDTYNAWRQAAASLPSNMNSLVCQIHSLLPIVQFFLNLQLSILLLLPFQYLLLLYQSWKTHSRIKIRLYPWLIDILLLGSVVWYLVQILQLLTQYQVLFDYTDISVYLSFIDELKQSQMTLVLGFIFFLLSVRLLSRLWAIPRYGQFCFIISALFQKVFVLIFFYLVFLTISSSTLSILVSYSSNHSFLNCINLILLKNYDQMSSNSSLTLLTLSCFRFIAFVLMPGIVFAILVSSISTILDKGKLQYRQHIIELNQLRNSKLGFLSSFDFPLSILSYFYFCTCCKNKRPLSPNHSSERIVYLFSIFIWSAYLFVLSIILLIPSYLYILFMRLIAIFKRSYPSFRSAFLTQSVQKRSKSVKHCKTKLCNFVTFLMFGLVILLLRSLNNFILLIKLSCKKEAEQAPEILIPEKIKITREWLEQLVAIINEDSNEKSPINSLNYISQVDGEMKQMQAINLSQIKEKWKDEPDIMKIDREEADLIIRADTSFSNSDYEMDQPDTEKRDVMGALVEVNQLLCGYETEDIISGR